MKVAGVLHKFVEKLAGKTTAEFERQRDELFREWTAELALALQAQGAHNSSLEMQIDELSKRVDDPVYLRAVEVLERESSLEPRQERRRMLAYVAAGWVNLEMTSSQISRVLRVVRELDPEDVWVLHQFSLIFDDMGEEEHQLTDFEPSPEGKRAHDFLRDNYPCGQLLLASACVKERYTTGLNNLGAEAHLTPVGQWVLKALSPYLRSIQEDENFLARPLEELAKRLPQGPHKERLQGYQELADLAASITKDALLQRYISDVPGSAKVPSYLKKVCSYFGVMALA